MVIWQHQSAFWILFSGSAEEEVDGAAATILRQLQPPNLKLSVVFTSKIYISGQLDYPAIYFGLVTTVETTKSSNFVKRLSTAADP